MNSIPETQRPGKPVDAEGLVGSVAYGSLVWLRSGYGGFSGEGGLGDLAGLLRCDVEKLRVADRTGEVGALGASRCDLLCVLAVVAGMDAVEVDGVVWHVVGPDPDAPASSWREGQAGGVL